ncbi:MAG: cobaltochelatase CobT [Planctomycetota bacterium]
MTTPKQPSSKQQQAAQELCGTTIRALTGLSELRHRGRSLFLAGHRVHSGAPHSQIDPLEDDFQTHRGIADGIAMRLAYSDSDLHRELYPDSPIQRLIFDLLEQLRVETLVENVHPGVQANLFNRFQQWSKRFHHSGHAETQLGLLIYTIAQIAWSRLSGNPTLEETDDLIEVTRGRITPVIGSSLAALRRHRNDQATYAEQALKIAQIVDESLEANPQLQSESAEIDNEKALARIALALDFSDDAEDSNIATIVTGNSKVLDLQDQVYHVYSRDYDRQIHGSSQVRDSELSDFRAQLDRLIFHQGINVPRLSRHLSELLATPRRDGWLFGEEEGLIDGRRLSQLVSAPSERRIFRKDQYRFKNDCMLSFLIDCSGSMKKSIHMVAMIVDIFARALDQSEITSEILGFTTGNWNGGQPQKDWIAEGRPEHPGRLNEQCHLVFKKADNSWRKSRRDIASMMKTPYFREGLDGEAVEWACQRMHKHGEARKILMVISDGSPMDTATSLANDEFYLDNHLKHMVDKYDQRNGLEIFGIGVGLDLTPYYNHSIALDLSESLSNHVFMQILQMVAHAQRR